VIILDKGLSAEAARGVRALSTSLPLKDWAGHGEGRAWKVVDADWQMRVAATAPESDQARVQVVQESHAAAVVDGKRWLYESIFWLRQEVPMDLTVNWDRPVRVMEAVVDGVAVSLLQPDANRLWLPLGARAGLCLVRIRWQDEPIEVGLKNPLLRRPKLKGISSGQADWTVHVPGGWLAQTGSGQSPLTGPVQESARQLAQATVQLETCRYLVERTREGLISNLLAAGQRRFYSACRRTRLGLEGGTGEGEEIAAQLQLLLDKNRTLAKRFQFEEVRQKAEKDVETGYVADSPGSNPAPLSTTGTPLLWQIGPDEPGPGVELVPELDRKNRRALADTLQWISFMSLVGLASLSPFIRNLFRRLWPEVLTLAGVLGWYLAGPTAVTLIILLCGLGGRIILCAAWLRSRLRQPAGQNLTLGRTAAEA
jgi:hypothetical protein